MQLIASRMELTLPEAHKTQKDLKHKILNGYLEIDIHLWNGNIKMDVNETSFAFRLNYSLQHGKKRNFGKSNEVILYEN